MSISIERRPQTPPNTVPPGAEVISTPAHQGTSSHSASNGFRNLGMYSAAPMIAHDVEKNDKSGIDEMLEFLLRQCATGDNGPVVQQSRGHTLLSDVLNAVVPICNKATTIMDAKKYCQEVKVEQDRYPLFVTLCNNLLQEVVNMNIPGLRDPSLDILFHRSDPAVIKGSHGDMDDARKPDIAVTELEKARDRAGQEDKHTTFKEFAASLALSQPHSGFSWEDLLAVAEFKIQHKSCNQPPEKYSAKLTKEFKHVEDIHGNLRAVPVDETPRLLANSKRVPDPGSGAQKPKPKQGLRQAQRGWLTAAQEPHQPQRPKRIAAEISTERNRVIMKSENKGNATPPSLRAEKAPEENDPSKNTVPPVVQIAAYGTEMLCRGSHASHAITLLILDDVVWIWWFDRQGAIQSTGINFIQDLPYLAALLVAFQRLDLKGWGVIDGLLPYEQNDNTAFTINFPEVQMVLFALAKPDIYERYNLTGRCTRVYTAIGAVNKDNLEEPLTTNPDLVEKTHDKEVALKIYWPEHSRPNEADILERAWKIGMSNIEVRGHIPELIASRDHAYSTGTVRDQVTAERVEGARSQSRVLRLVVLKLLLPLNPDTLPMDDFMRGWKQCFICHFHLWEGGIEHGDISLGNLMWDSETQKGVLGDFDFATLRDERQLRGRERTGTVPFMAIDLLTKDYYDGKVTRRYRHDVESFVWVLIWVFLRHEIDQTWNERLWRTSDYVLCRGSKSEFIMLGFNGLNTRGGGLWGLTSALVDWLKLVYMIPPGSSSRRSELEDKGVFGEVREIIEKNWEWDSVGA